MSSLLKRALAAAESWAWPAPVQLQANQAGLINDTYWVNAGGVLVAVLQRLNTDIFVPEVHEDIEAVTGWLEETGLCTPRLLRTSAGTLWHVDADGSVWRCSTVAGDRTVHKIDDPCDAGSAGRLVARFHCALDAFRWEFRSVRPAAHDTARHMAHLRRALESHAEHRLYRDTDKVAWQILTGWDHWQGGDELPLRVIHGDLKISNVRFSGPEAVALIDLDTLAWGTWDIEMGDAMRSWCNPAHEEVTDPEFNLELFAAAMGGYVQGCAGKKGPSSAEWEALVPGIERICLELAARFAYDALEECYFGFDPRFGGRGEHNLLRARGQVALARSVHRLSDEARRIVARVRAEQIEAS